jgi:hypothetical protein
VGHPGITRSSSLNFGAVVLEKLGVLGNLFRSQLRAVARAGLVAIVPANVRHSVKALTDGRAIIVDYPLRRDFN